MAGGNVPRALAPVFVQAGNQYKIPPQVLAGVASVETNLGANRSTSSTGAEGLMQFEPGTARGIGINPLNDRQAIFGAAKLLTQYGYHQNPLRALGAYNGGPGNPQYSYANQVMSEANRLKGQLAGAATQTMPGPRATSATAVGPAMFKTTTTQGFDQAGFQAAQKASVAGNYLAGSSKDPYAVGAPKTGLEGAASLSGILPTAAPNPADYQTAQTQLEKIAGKPLNQHPAAFQANMQAANAKGGNYVNPLPGATWERTDMGVDASMPNGAPIHAITDSTVTNIHTFYKGQPIITFKILNGPDAGKFYYISEAINSRVHVGQTVHAGQVVGTYNSGGTGLELGWAGNAGGSTLAQTTTGYSEGQQTAAGKSFRNFLNGLGARAG